MKDDEIYKALLSAHDGKLVLVGGQSIIFWSNHYKTPENDRLSTDDIDFFGDLKSAKHFAKNANAKIIVPTPDYHTPNVAVIEIISERGKIIVDFLSDVAGVKSDKIAANALEIALADASGNREFSIRIMHPLHCLQSKIANKLNDYRLTPVGSGRGAEA